MKLNFANVTLANPGYFGQSWYDSPRKTPLILDSRLPIRPFDPINENNSPGLKPNLFILDAEGAGCCCSSKDGLWPPLIALFLPHSKLVSWTGEPESA